MGFPGDELGGGTAWAATLAYRQGRFGLAGTRALVNHASADAQAAFGARGELLLARSATSPFQLLAFAGAGTMELGDSGREWRIPAGMSFAFRAPTPVATFVSWLSARAQWTVLDGCDRDESRVRRGDRRDVARAVGHAGGLRPAPARRHRRDDLRARTDLHLHLRALMRRPRTSPARGHADSRGLRDDVRRFEGGRARYAGLRGRGAAPGRAILGGEQGGLRPVGHHHAAAAVARSARSAPSSWAPRRCATCASP